MADARAQAHALLADLPTNPKVDFRTQIQARGSNLAPTNPLWEMVEDHLDDHDFMIDDLVLIGTGAASRLAQTTPERAVDIAERLAEHLMTGKWAEGRNFGVANLHLDWLKAVLEGLLQADRLDLFGDLAPEYCAAVKSCDRYPHNDRLRPWLAGLTGNAGTAMARAIQQAGVVEYMKDVMDGRRVAHPRLAALLER